MQFFRRCFSLIVTSDRSVATRTVFDNSLRSRLCSSASPETVETVTKNTPRKRNQKKDLSVLNLPERPKKPATTFIRFLVSVRSEILKGNPDLPQTELMRYAAHLWKNADTETRTKFQVQYYSDLEKYLDDMQNYYSSLTAEQRIALAEIETQQKENRYRKIIREKLKDLEKPKRPMNAFNLFLISKQHELKNIRAQDYMHELAMQWKELPEEEKKKFSRKSKKLQLEYYKQLAEWKERVGPMNIMQVLRRGDFEVAKQYLKENSLLSDAELEQLQMKDS